MRKGKLILVYATLSVAGLYFLFVGLVKAESFLVPLLTAMVLAFLMMPITNKFEKWKWPKALATLTSTLIILLVAVGFFSMVFFQVKNFADDWEEIQERLEEQIGEITDFLVQSTPLDQEQIDSVNPNNNQEEEEQEAGAEEEGEEIDEGEAKQAGEQAMTVAGSIFSFLIDFLIVFVYIFLFIHFRSRFKEFILRFFAPHRRKEVQGIILKSASVSRSYLAGRLLLLVILAVFYYIGLMISGLENAIIISLVAAALSFIPFVGNFIGYAIALAFSLLTDGETGMILGITITFIVAQFIDSYILQPIVLGDKVDVHPFFIILSVILGNEIWGVMGMVLAIPIFGMVTVVCRHVPALNPFAYLFSKTEVEETTKEAD